MGLGGAGPGRSEDTPGDLSSELLMLDASAVISKLYPGKKVFIFIFLFSISSHVLFSE